MGGGGVGGWVQTILAPDLKTSVITLAHKITQKWRQIFERDHFGILQHTNSKV